MAIPVLKFELEEPVEDRIGKLEAHVEHIRADVADTKIEVRRLNDKVDGLGQKMSDKTDAVDQRLSAKIDEGKDALASLALRMEKLFAELKIGRALDRVWWLLMCGTLLGVMARGFKWI
jgi:hypothetical protein